MSKNASIDSIISVHQQCLVTELTSMLSSGLFPLAISIAALLGQCQGSQSPPGMLIPRPNLKSQPVPRDLQSFSIEFAFFPDYAGNKSHPNVFSKNLLKNFKDLTGVYPLVRVGGTSQ